MKNIELSDEQYEGIESVAKSLELSITDLILRGVKACTLLLDLFPEENSLKVPIKNVPVDNPILEESKYKVTIAGVPYTANTLKELLLAVVTGLGPKKIFVSYTGRSNLIKATLEKDDRLEFFTKVTEDKHTFYIHTHMSEEGCFKRIQDIAECLNLEWSKA
jgi:hypothetical protein